MRGAVAAICRSTWSPTPAVRRASVSPRRSPPRSPPGSPWSSCATRTPTTTIRRARPGGGGGAGRHRGAVDRQRPGASGGGDRRRRGARRAGRPRPARRQEHARTRCAAGAFGADPWSTSRRLAARPGRHRLSRGRPGLAADDQAGRRRAGRPAAAAGDRRCSPWPCVAIGGIDADRAPLVRRPGRRGRRGGQRDLRSARRGRWPPGAQEGVGLTVWPDSVGLAMG